MIVKNGKIFEVYRDGQLTGAYATRAKAQAAQRKHLRTRSIEGATRRLAMDKRRFWEDDEQVIRPRNVRRPTLRTKRRTTPVIKNVRGKVAQQAINELSTICPQIPVILDELLEKGMIVKISAHKKSNRRPEDFGKYHIKITLVTHGVNGVDMSLAMNSILRPCGNPYRFATAEFDDRTGNVEIWIFVGGTRNS